jgi:serine/threonine protein kinase/Flp pilus assembly protein TadD
MPSPTTHPVDAALDLDAFVTEYEEARHRDGRADLRDHLPPAGHPDYLRILAELIRVEIEYAWGEGKRPQAADYLATFPELSNRPDLVGDLAYEEYRQRLEVGEVPELEDFQVRYGIDTSEWDHCGEPAAEVDDELTPQSVETAARAYQRFRAGEDGDVDFLATNVAPGLTPSAAALFQELHRANPTRATRLAEGVTSFPEVGDVFLDFHLVAELGRGAFGRVFLAQQQGLAQRPVALKIAVNLHDEAQTLARLQHANIVPIHSVHYVEGLQAVCMPYFGRTTLAHLHAQVLAGENLPTSGKTVVSTLRDQQRADSPSTMGGTNAPTLAGIDLRPGRSGHAAGAGTLPPHAPLQNLENLGYAEAILWLMARVADGLAHAHDRGILHCDLKPANILLSDEGEPMLLDFNLAEEIANGALLAAVGGTLPYMSPEQMEAFLNPGIKLTPASDLYALGVILYELLTGKHPFPHRRGKPLADALPEMVAARRRGAPRLRCWNKRVTPAIEAIVRRCLEPDLARRYQSAHELREDLQRQLQSLPLKHTPEPSWGERLAKFRRRHPRLLSISSCLLALATSALLLVAALFWREQQLTTLQSRAAARDLREDRRELEFLLAARSAPEFVPQALERGQQALARFAPGGARLERLPTAEREQAREDLSAVRWLCAQAHLLRVDPARPSCNDLDQAERFLSAALAETDPEAVPRSMRLQQARIARLRGQDAEARALEQQASATAPWTAHDWYQMAFSLAEQGRFRQARDHIREAVRQAPDSFNAWFLHGICCDMLGRDAESIHCYTVCVALRPKFFAPYFNRGLALARQQQVTAARDDFSKAIDLRGDFADGYFNRALTYQETAELPLAENDLTQALILGATQTRLFFARARIRDRRQNAEGARADREEGLRREPQDAESWVARALHRLPDDPQGALADLEAALKLDPRSLPALQNQAHVLVKYLKQTEEAVRVLDRTVALYPDDVRPRAGRGVLLARLGRNEGARADAEAALALEDAASNQYQVAGIYALLARQDASQADVAFRLLSSALKKGFGQNLLAIDPDLAPIRQDPRFARLQALAGVLGESGR